MMRQEQHRSIVFLMSHPDKMGGDHNRQLHDVFRVLAVRCP
jgi:hypothetical protein